MITVTDAYSEKAGVHTAALHPIYFLALLINVVFGPTNSFNNSCCKAYCHSFVEIRPETFGNPFLYSFISRHVLMLITQLTAAS